MTDKVVIFTGSKRDFDTLLESQIGEYEETIPDDGYTEPDYEAEGAQLIEDYINEQEDIPR